MLNKQTANVNKQVKRHLLSKPKLVSIKADDSKSSDMERTLLDCDNNMEFPEITQPTTSQHNDSQFVHPPKRKLATNVNTYHKKYILDPVLLCKENKFDKLSDHNYAMTDNEDSEMTHEPVKKTKIPPIFLHDVNNYQAVIEDIKTNIQNEFVTAVKGNNLKISLTDIDDFRKLTRFYEDSEVKFHTFKAAQDKKLEVVFRNVPTSLTEDEIKSELLLYNLPVCKVVRMLNKNKVAIPLCIVELENSENAVEVFNINNLCHALVSVEAKRKPKDVPQCTRCQRYGHTKNFCHLDPRCVRCTGQHHFSQCPLAKQTAPQCVNCGENHTANFKGCKYYQNLKHKSSRPTAKSNINNTSEAKPNSERQPAEPHSSNRNGRRTSVSYADVLNSRKSPNDMQEDDLNSNNNMPTSNECESGIVDISNLETMLITVVKSFLPQIKSLLLNIIASLFENGK